MSDPTMAAARPTKLIIARKPRDRRGKYGVPVPAGFNFNALADDTLLSNYDVAAVLRRAQATVQTWRMNPDHPLGPHAWEYIDGKPLLRAKTLRAFMASRRANHGKAQ